MAGECDTRMNKCDNDGKLLTIIVPAYNSERYLRKCLDSFADARLLSNIEVIVINDGSKDGTLKIAQEYALKYPQTFSAVDKENGGHGSGINVGSKLAKGKYFQVVDSDDWVLTGNVFQLLDYLRNTCADVVLCQYHMVDMKSGKRQAFEIGDIPLNKEYTLEEFMAYPRNARNCCFFHGVIYRTQFYRETGIELSEKTFYEDQEYATLPFYYVKTILPLDLFIYQYQVGNEAQSISNTNQVKNMGQIEKVFWRICEFYILHSDMDEVKKTYFLFKMSTLLLSYYVAGLLKMPDRKKGRLTAETMRKGVAEKCPELAQCSERKYQVAVLLHKLHISAAMLERAKKTKMYYFVRKFL